jgi:hypothetical protein
MFLMRRLASLIYLSFISKKKTHVAACNEAPAITQHSFGEEALNLSLPIILFDLFVRKLP